jgi:hypothetical protein
MAAARSVKYGNVAWQGPHSGKHIAIRPIMAADERNVFHGDGMDRL